VVGGSLKRDELLGRVADILRRSNVQDAEELIRLLEYKVVAACTGCREFKLDNYQLERAIFIQNPKLFCPDCRKIRKTQRSALAKKARDGLRALGNPIPLQYGQLANMAQVRGVLTQQESDVLRQRSVWQLSSNTPDELEGFDEAEAVEPPSGPVDCPYCATFLQPVEGGWLRCVGCGHTQPSGEEG
jgi:hypothetical protein